MGKKDIISENTMQEHLAQWLNGNEKAYRHLFDHYYPKLFSVCYRTIRQREDCEELVLTVFLKLWQHQDRLLQTACFEKYLFGILRNQMADFFRKRLLQTETIETQPLQLLGITNQPDPSLKELEKRYREALLKLPEKQRIVFLMSREEGLPQKQIAMLNNISINTVNNHIKSAMKSIRRDLGEFSEVLPAIVIISSSGFLG